MTLNWTDGALAKGLACYRRAEYFDAHEHWESVWVNSQGQERNFLQALIQTTVALHHLQRGNLAGARSLLQRALLRLAPCSSGFGGIEVTLLRTEISQLVQNLDEQIPNELAQYPQLHIHTSDPKALNPELIEEN
jgi:predicted metal-dependent hydrolase